MGKKGPLTWVTPKEFKERTALALHSRSATTQHLDLAYAAYWESQSEYKAKQLYDALQAYMIEHGGYWNRCQRNQVSGGLLQWMYDELAPPSVRKALRENPSGKDHIARELINAHEIPHSRYGVLYLLGNLKIEPDVFSLVLEGVGTVGSTVGHSLTTDFGNLGSKNNATHLLTEVRGVKVTGRTVTSAGSAGVSVVGTLAGSSGSVTAKPPPPGEPTTWFPCTGAVIERTTAGIGDMFDEKRYFTGVAAGVGATLAAPVVLTGALLADAGIAIVRAAKALWDKLMGVFSGLADTVKRKFQDRMFIGSSVGALIKAVIKFAVDKVLAAAAPFIGGAIDMGTGLVRAIEGACVRIASWLDRRQIRIVPGHPEEIANSIEHCMEVGIFKGLLDILKGAAKTAVQIIGPGLGAVVAAAMAAMEWLVKVIIRIIESEGIKTFLTEARTKYEEQRARAQLQPSPGHVNRVPVRGNLEPHIDGTGLLCNTQEFTEFFKRGCAASPLIPMLTLNSGICGSLMTMVKLFDDDTGAMLVNSGAKRQPFDIGGDYFRRLKLFAVEYLQASGFVFSPLDLQDDSIRGLLNHATGKPREVMVNGKLTTMTSHVRPPTVGNAVLAGLKA
jgi:hypothetical protein